MFCRGSGKGPRITQKGGLGALLPAQPCRYALPRASSIENFIPPLPTFIDGVVDSWLDATPVDYAMHLTLHLARLEQFCPRAKDPSIVKELKPEHRDFYLRCLSLFGTDGINGERMDWRRSRRGA